MRENEIIISAGPAGTGKTFLAVAVGLTMLLEKNWKNNLSRPAVEAGKRLVFYQEIWRESWSIFETFIRLAIWFVPFWKNTKNDRNWWYRNSAIGIYEVEL